MKAGLILTGQDAVVFAANVAARLIYKREKFLISHRCSGGEQVIHDSFAIDQADLDSIGF